MGVKICTHIHLIFSPIFVQCCVRPYVVALAIIVNSSDTREFSARMEWPPCFWRQRGYTLEHINITDLNRSLPVLCLWFACTNSMHIEFHSLTPNLVNNIFHKPQISVILSIHLGKDDCHLAMTQVSPFSTATQLVHCAATTTAPTLRGCNERSSHGAVDNPMKTRAPLSQTATFCCWVAL